MAGDTRTVAAGGGNWGDASTWVEGAVPVDTDIVVFDYASGDVVLNENSAALGELDMEGYAGTLSKSGDRTITVDGAVALGGTITGGVIITLTGTGTITCNDTEGVSWQNFSGEYTQTDELLGVGILFNDGTLHGANKGATIAGSIVCPAGSTWVDSGTVVQTEDGDLQNPTYTNAWDVLDCAKAGKTSTLGQDVWTKKLITGPGTVEDGGGEHTLVITPYADDFFEQSQDPAAVFAPWQLSFFAREYSNGRIDFSACHDGLWWGCDGSDAGAPTLTMTGDLIGGDKLLRISTGSRNNDTTVLDLNGHNMSAGGVRVGNPGSGDARDGRLVCGSGVIEIGADGLASGGGASVTAATGIDHNGGTVILEGTYDGTAYGATKMSITSAGAHVHGGTIQDVDLSSSGPLHCFGRANPGAGGNTNVVDCPAPMGPGLAMLAA